MKSTPSVKYLKLPFTFDEALLKKDLDSISSSSWLPQIYTMNYQGEWTSLALISCDGGNDTFSASSTIQVLKPTPILNKSPYFQEVLSSFKCPLITARLLRLNAHSEIKPHRDFKLGYEDNNFRIHIPIITNPQIEFILGGDQLVMSPGECWYTNVNFVHSVANRSNEDRIHLVIDCERNQWSDEIFFSLAPKSSFGVASINDERETILKTIEALEERNDIHLNDMIEELKNKLQ